jgi:hypothetical protein
LRVVLNDTGRLSYAIGDASDFGAKYGSLKPEQKALVDTSCHNYFLLRSSSFEYLVPWRVN